MSWLIAPVVMLAVCLGCGLLVWLLGGARLPKVFILPLGFAAVLVVAGITTSFDATSAIGPFVLVPLALAGLVVGRATIVDFLRRPGVGWWALAGALLAFAVVAAPLLLSGASSFTGYARIVDIPHQFSLSAYLFSEGRTPIAVSDSSSTEIVRKTLGAGYPGGWQSALAAFGELLRTDLAWLYQPLLAVTSAMTALGLFALLRGAIDRAPVRALAAGAAAQANILYAYGVAGGFKELTGACLVVLVAALCGTLMRERAVSVRDAIPLGTAVAGGITALSVAVVPFTGVILAGALIVTAWRPETRRRVLIAAATTAAIVAVTSLPIFTQVSKLANVAAAAEGPGRTAIVDLGNLAAPVPVRAAAGVWITNDYRVPSVTTQPVSDVLVVLVLLLALLGVVHAVRRRELGLAIAAAAAAIALAYYASRTGPWIELKAIAITGPLSLACAFAGAASIGGWVRSRAALGRALGLAVPALLAVAVLAGNAFAYHNASIAPVERMRELERIGERYAGRGQAFHPAFDDTAEYFLRRTNAIALVNQPAGRQAVARPGVEKEGTAFAWDLDDLRMTYVQSFPLLILRRSPLASRPPANYELAERTGYYEVWRRTRPASAVLSHLPVAADGRRSARTCRRFESLAGRAAKGARVAYVEVPPVAVWRLGRRSVTRSPNWGPGGPPETLAVSGRGHANARLTVEEPGEYDLWIGGSFGRPFEVKLEGRPFIRVSNRRNYPEQFEPVGRQRLEAGTHRVRAERPGGDLRPGSSTAETAPIGPVVAVRTGVEPGIVRHAPLSRAGEICRSDLRLDWLEIVRDSFPAS